MSFHPAMDYGAGFHRSQRRVLPEGPPFELTPERRARLDEVVRRYPPEHKRSAVLFALYLVQEQIGYVSGHGVRQVAAALDLTPAEVEDVASYYTMFHKQPVGTYVLQVCRTLSCGLNGAERVVERIEETLGITVGQTDPSGTFTLQEFECLGACDRAPVMMVNNEHWHERLQPEEVPGLLERIRSGGETALSGCHLQIEQRPPDGPRSTAPVDAPRMAPILTPHVWTPGAHTLDTYLKHDGYEGLKKALAKTPQQVIDDVKASGLRGRGGAGFPTGMKWQFVDRASDKPRYIVCNADESEPGTFKDHLLMERNPHLLIEGCAIGCYAIDARVAYIYLRGEFFHFQPMLERAIEEAYARGFLGKNILGSGFDCDVYLHRGAGAYEAGEETALLESLEGKRAQPRIKPPFPASWGLYGSPTAVNNVETLCNVPLIMTGGAEWYASLGPEKNGGPKMFCVSGHVARPGVYEASMFTTLRELIYGYAGGMAGGRQLKAVIPGGSSVPILLPDQLDTPASFDDIQRAGSLLGSAAIIVMDETTPMPWVALNLLHFYRHESCGKCTPCREGTDWLYKILARIERGEGEMKDLDLLLSVANSIVGKTLCAFGDAAATPVLTTIKHFQHEFERYIREGRPPSPSWRGSREHAPVGAH